MDILKNIGLSPEVITTFEGLFITLGIGLLLGLERESSKKEKKERLFAGVRTFPIVSLLGYLTLYLADRYSPFIYVAALIAVVGITGLAYLRTHNSDVGTTTEFSLLMAFILGSLVFTTEYYLAVIVAVAVAGLLSLKLKLHEVAKSLSQQDILSILYFVIITALVLPLLPNQDFGPYGIFNPYKTWLIVAIFVTLNFLAYFLSKFLSQRRSTILTGILGGFASSTATAWYFSRESSTRSGNAVTQAAAILLASSIMFPRLLIWLLILNRNLLAAIWLPVLLFGLLGLGIGYYLSRQEPEQATEEKQISNPINFKEGVVFALAYIVIQFLVGYAEEEFGSRGVLVAAGISGLTDVDAITVSMANYGQESVSRAIAGLAVIIAALSNTLVKYGFCLAFGSAPLKRYSSYGFLPLFLVTLGYIVVRLLTI